MNIFCLDSNPISAAKFQCDKHVVKMTLESAQLLCSAHLILDGNEASENFYRLTHKNHPCTIWTRENSSNYKWLYEHFTGLCDEYRFRYGKTHLTDKKLRNDLSIPPANIMSAELTPFALAIPDQFKVVCPVESYRKYYRSKTSQFQMKWTKREVPGWFQEEKNPS